MVEGWVCEGVICGLVLGEGASSSEVSTSSEELHVSHLHTSSGGEIVQYCMV